MDNYRRYQPYRTRRDLNPVPWVRRLVVLAGIVLIVVFLARLGRSEPTSDSGNAPGGAGSGSAGNVAPLLTVAAGTTNGNVNAATTPSIRALTTAQCPVPVSRGVDRKQVALTFTAGTGPGQTERLRDLLKERGVPATFFVSGQWAEAHAELAKSLADAGFTIGNVTHDRTDPTTLTAAQLTEQLDKADAAIQAATGRSSKPYFRPPQGQQNADVVATAKTAGYCTILWTVDAFDWQDGQTVDGAIERVRDRGGSGAIIVLQVASDLVVDIIPKLVDDLKAQGYTLVSLDALLAA